MGRKLIWSLFIVAGLALLGLSALANPHPYAWSDSPELASQLRGQSVEVGALFAFGATLVLASAMALALGVGRGSALRRWTAAVSAALLLLAGAQSVRYGLLLHEWHVQQAAPGAPEAAQ